MWGAIKGRQSQELFITQITMPMRFCCRCIVCISEETLKNPIEQCVCLEQNVVFHPSLSSHCHSEIQLL